VDYSGPGHVSSFVDTPDFGRATAEPVRVYSAAIANDEGGPWWQIGSFVYVEGTFRYLGYLETNSDWQTFFREYGKPFNN
jgi:hypothetical protein